MSKEENNRTFPPNESQGLDRERFASLLRDAIPTYLDLLKNEDLPAYRRALYEPNEEGGISTFEIEFPHYGKVRANDDPLAIPEIENLFSYIWGRGELKKTLSGEDPRRSNWERHVLIDIIHAPIARVLSENAIEDAIDFGEISPWQLSEEDLDRLVNELTTRHCEGENRYMAKVPLGNVQGETGTAWKLNDNICLSLYTRREAAGYLSRYRDAFSPHERLGVLSPFGIPHVNFPVLEIILPWPQNSDEPRQKLEEEIADTIDLTKWAMMVTVDENRPLIEGPVVYGRILGETHPLKTVSFERQARSPKQIPIYDPTNEEIELTQELLKHTPRVRAQSNPLDGALWHFGRCCLARLSRDTLLEAVVGLEHLLIEGRSTSYRLGLYGAAVIGKSSEEAKEIFSQIKDIYGQRSAAVHSRQKESEKAEIARKILGDAIFGIMEIIRDGMIHPSQQNIPQEIQKRVLREAPFRNDDHT